MTFWQTSISKVDGADESMSPSSDVNVNLVVDRKSKIPTSTRRLEICTNQSISYEDAFDAVADDFVRMYVHSPYGSESTTGGRWGASRTPDFERHLHEVGSDDFISETSTDEMLLDEQLLINNLAIITTATRSQITAALRNSSGNPKLAFERLSANKSSPQPHTSACVVCLQNKRSRVVVPCGHLCLCDVCAISQVTKTKMKCPVCTSTCTMIMQVHW